MRESLKKYAPRSMAYGLVMAAVSFFRGGVRYSSDGLASFPPVWIQLAKNFAVYALVFLAVFALADAVSKS